MNAFAAAFVAILTARDATRRSAAQAPCGRLLGRPQARYSADPGRMTTRVRDCTCRDAEARDCARD